MVLLVQNAVHLEVLDLSHNSLGDDGAVTLAAALTSPGMRVYVSMCVYIHLCVRVYVRVCVYTYYMYMYNRILWGRVHIHIMHMYAGVYVNLQSMFHTQLNMNVFTCAQVYRLTLLAETTSKSRVVQHEWCDAFRCLTAAAQD